MFKHKNVVQKCTEIHSIEKKFLRRLITKTFEKL